MVPKGRGIGRMGWGGKSGVKLRQGCCARDSKKVFIDDEAGANPWHCEDLETVENSIARLLPRVDYRPVPPRVSTHTSMRTTLAGVLTLGLLASSADAAFHLVQIEEIIGGVNGNPLAQAIQLRLRSAGNNAIGPTRLRAWDALGQNPITLFDIPTSVTNGLTGDRVLLTTVAFNTVMAGVPGYSTDFTLTTPIPSSYLSGGKVTFENDAGTLIYWGLAFGSYTGTNLGSGDNDTDFGAPFATGLPTAAAQGIHFGGAATAPSTTNAADYSLTSNPATVINNARTSFTVVPEPGSLAFVSLGAAALGGLVFARRRR